jgi:hypothetical protein
MASINLIEAFQEFKDAENIDRPTMMKVVEDVFKTLLRKKYGSDDNFDVIVNAEKGDLEIIRRRLIVEEGILNRAEGSNKTKSSKSLSKKQSDENTEKLKQALHKLSTRINSKSDVKLDEKVLDKFIEELDGDGKAEVLKRKLSMYLKMKKSSQSNLSDNSDSFRSENKIGIHETHQITTNLDDTQLNTNEAKIKADIPIRTDTIKATDNEESGIPVLLRQAIKKDSERLQREKNYDLERVENQVNCVQK